MVVWGYEVSSFSERRHESYEPELQAGGVVLLPGYHCEERALPAVRRQPWRLLGDGGWTVTENVCNTFTLESLPDDYIRVDEIWMLIYVIHYLTEC